MWSPGTTHDACLKLDAVHPSVRLVGILVSAWAACDHGGAAVTPPGRRSKGLHQRFSGTYMSRMRPVVVLVLLGFS